MPTHKPQRAAPGASLILPRIDGSVEATQRAFDQVSLLIRQSMGLIGSLRTDVEAFSSSSPASTGGDFFDTILDVRATPISFGAAYDNWAPGTLGRKTLIIATTDGSSRSVRGLVGGADGMVVFILNVNSGVQVIDFQHEDGAASTFNRFVNAGGAARNGGAFGTVAYYYDGTGATGRWRALGDTT